MNQEKTDRELIQQYLETDGADDEALRALVERYYRQVYHFVYQYTGSSDEADDVTQVAFVKAWKHLKKFDLEKSFKTWIFQIAKNTALDALKKKKMIPFSVFETDDGGNVLLESVPDDQLLPDDLARRGDIAEMVNAAVSHLPSDGRVVLTMYYQQGFNFREIAEVLGESIDTVKSRHRRALLSLRKAISEE